MTRREPPRRGNARGAGPDYHDVHISGHLLHLMVGCLVSSYLQAAAAAAGLNLTKWEFSFRTRIGQPKI